MTARGAKHLAELAVVARAGHRAVMLYLVQRNDCRAMRLAADIDPVYAAGFAEARAAGVEVMALGTALSPQAISPAEPVAFLP